MPSRPPLRYLQKGLEPQWNRSPRKEVVLLRAGSPYKEKKNQETVWMEIQARPPTETNPPHFRCMENMAIVQNSCLCAFIIAPDAGQVSTLHCCCCFGCKLAFCGWWCRFFLSPQDRLRNFYEKVLA